MKNFLLTFLVLMTQVLLSQIYLMDATPVTACSGSFYDSGGSGGQYGNSQNITKVFTPGIPGQAVVFTFNNFNTQAPFDYMEIFDGASTSDPQIGMYTGNVSIGIIRASVNNPTGQLTVRFVSNGAVTAAGWDVTVSCGAKGTPQYCMNNQPLTVCNGVFTDPCGPSLNYLNSQNFTKTLFPATPGQGISLNFTQMDLEEYFDQIEVFDGPNVSSPLICQITGTATAFAVSAGASNVTGALTLRFTSNGAVVRPGWLASISCVTKGTPTMALQTGTYNSICSAIITDSGGQSGNYFWLDNETATYCPPPGMCTQLAISGVSVEPLGDILSVYDGMSTSDPLMATYHNTASVSGIFQASTQNSSGCLTLRFIEDGWTLFPGWSSTLSCVPCTQNPLYAMQTGTVQTCAAFHSDNGGPFGSYLDSQDIIQTICPSNTATPYVRIDFSNFVLENNYDLLRIYNGPGITSPLMGTATGTISSFFAAATNSTGCLTLRFTSDFNSPFSGWTGTVSCIGEIILPVELTDFKGEFTPENDVLLLWNSLEEVNILKYIVQRSEDGIHFKDMGELFATGSRSSYQFRDSDPVKDIGYYRLKISEKDHTFSYSKIIAVLMTVFSEELKIVPNPCSHEFNIYLSLSSEQGVFYAIYNGLGEEIKSNSVDAAKGVNMIHVPVTELTDGIYTVKVKAAGREWQNKLIVLNK